METGVVQEVAVNEAEMRQEALSVVERAKIVKITDQASYDGACSLLQDLIKPFRIRWKDYWYGTVSRPGPIRLAQQAKDSLMAKFNEGDGPLEIAERQVKAELLIWDDKQRRIREELQKQAQAKAEAEAKAEQEKQALFAELAGAAAEDVEAIATAPVVVVAPPIEPTYERTAGISRRSNWKAKVVDLKKLCKAIGEGKVPTTYVVPNDSALNARAKADKSTLNIPGVVAYDDPTIAGRSK